MFLKNKHKLLLLIVLTIFFSFLIFITKSYFFWWLNDYENRIIEEKYIEPEVVKVNDDLLDKKIEEKILETLSSAYKLRYTFFPSRFIEEENAKEYYSVIDTFLNSSYIINKISFLEIYIFKEDWIVRGKMKDKKVRLYGIYNMKKEEFLSVSIHEFAHFLDLYFLEKNVTNDISDYFYSISWDSTTVIKSWQNQEDFVSWYSMTNKYEDFAESFTYYVLHNSDFKEKTLDSSRLKEKYDFFEKYLFRKKEFQNDSYKTTHKVDNYYRDITKISFSLENFLQYLKK